MNHTNCGHEGRQACLQAEAFRAHQTAEAEMREVQQYHPLDGPRTQKAAQALQHAINQTEYAARATFPSFVPDPKDLKKASNRFWVVGADGSITHIAKNISEALDYASDPDLFDDPSLFMRVFDRNGREYRLDGKLL